MAMNQRLRSMAPYAAQVLSDEEVRDAGKRVLAAATKAYGRTKRPRPKRKAITDAKLWQRLAETLTAAFELLAAISTPPPPPKRRWPRRLAVLALIGGGVALAANADVDARAALRGAVGKSAPPVPDTPGTSAPPVPDTPQAGNT